MSIVLCLLRLWRHSVYLRQSEIKAIHFMIFYTLKFSQLPVSGRLTKYCQWFFSSHFRIYVSFCLPCDILIFSAPGCHEDRVVETYKYISVPSDASVCTWSVSLNNLAESHRDKTLTLQILTLEYANVDVYDLKTMHFITRFVALVNLMKDFL